MRDDLFQHYKRWNIEISDNDVFQSLKYRLAQQFLPIEKEIPYDSEVRTTFNYLAGKPLWRPDTSIIVLLIGTNVDYGALVHRLQLFFIALKEHDRTSHIESCYSAAKSALEYSASVGLEIVKVGNSVTLYPRGAKLLDEAVVNQTLLWLEPHPSALSPFERTLKLYMEGDKSTERNLLDNLRRSVEELLRDILENGKSLENQSKELLTWLDAKGVHKQTVNMYHALLFGPYSKFQNDAVKHGEDFVSSEIEFTIYLTGTFMRLLLQLEQAE